MSGRHHEDEDEGDDVISLAAGTARLRKLLADRTATPEAIARLWERQDTHGIDREKPTGFPAGPMIIDDPFSDPLAPTERRFDG